MSASATQSPEWIWPDQTGNTNVCFRQRFNVPLRSWNARLTATSDGPAQVFLNGKLVGTIPAHHQPFSAEVMVRLNQGANIIAIQASPGANGGGVIAHLDIGGKPEHTLISNESWRFSTTVAHGWNELHFDDTDWRGVKSLGRHGIDPWGEILFRPMATSAAAISVPDGFTVTRLHSSGPDEGSWVGLTFDPKGRMIISSQDASQRLLRVTFNTDGAVSQIERLAAPIGFAMGMLFAHGHFYVNGTGPDGPGLYRLTDANIDDQFSADEMKLLQQFSRSGEHGYHGLALGPKGWIYVMNGNSTRIPGDLATTSPLRNYDNDLLLPSAEATNAKGGQQPPAGHVLRTDPDGRKWELFCGGFRNAYDIDFSPEGELFTFDSDNEWDWGLPWYRPTIVHHATAGSDFGWREGIRLWPQSYEDRPADCVPIGIGSPTGVKFGTRSNFPEAYRRALFVQDWSYGRILAVHLTPKGAGFTGSFEPFLQGRPLNLTDLDFGPDGAMYFITGGRNTQSGLYRVEWKGIPHTEPLIPSSAGSDARELRQRLKSGQVELDTIWRHLGSDDRHLRHAARLALERLPLARWRDRSLKEPDTDAALTALLALVRSADKSIQSSLLAALATHELSTLTSTQRQRRHRILQLTLIRHGRPAEDALVRLREELSAHYPADNWPENRELSRLLQWIGAPDFVPKTLERLQAAGLFEQQMHYVSLLSAVKEGWNEDQRRTFFRWWQGAAKTAARSHRMRQWFADVDRNYADGLMVDSHLSAFREQAIGQLSEADRDALGTLLDEPIAAAQLIPAKPRTLVRAWKLSELADALNSPLTGRDFERGRQAFVDAQCLACHRFDGQGGITGPELDSAGNKYDLRSLLESILEPSRVINEQYHNTTITYDEDFEATGRVLEATDRQIVLLVDPLNHTTITIPRDQVRSLAPTGLSAMPTGLVDVLTREEILDLLAYLQSGGRRNHAAFR